MKVIIAGKRNFYQYDTLLRAIRESKFEITELVSGGAPGVDTISIVWARENNIPIKLFKADWQAHGKSAGPIRNQQMAEYGEALIALWDYNSTGTKNMIEQATKKGLKIFVYDITN